VAGGGHSCDPRWLAQEWVDDAETWGKTTARTQGLARHEESPNGKASRWLADSEGAAAAYLGVGEKQWNGGSFGRSVAFIPQRREREGCVVPHVSDVGRRLAGPMGTRRGDDSLVPGQTHMWVWSV
jgi:hypothetical protein